MLSKCCFVLFLLGSLGFSQSFKIKEDLRIKGISTHKIENTSFSIIKNKNSKTKKYEYQFYYLKDSVSVYLSKYESVNKQKLELYHLFEDKLVFVFSSITEVLNNSGGSSSLKTHTLLSINIMNGDMKVESLKMSKELNVKFSHKDYSCFINLNKTSLSIATIIDCGRKKIKSISLPQELLSKYPNFKLSDLKLISNKAYAENIGAPDDRLYFDDDNIYLTYFLKKKALVFKLDKINEDFVWSGYNELSFGFEGKVKDYNSFLIRDKFYLISEYDNKILFKVLDLISSDNTEYELEDLVNQNIIDKKVLANVVSGLHYPNQVPSLMVHKKKGSLDEIISISYIPKRTTYLDSSMLHDMMFNQQMMFHQQMMNNHTQSIRASMPGGFMIVGLPSIERYIAKDDKTLKFVIDKNKEVFSYNDEKIELEKYNAEKVENDYLLALASVKKNYKRKLKYFSFLRLKDVIYYAYYDKNKKELVFDRIEKI